MTKRFVGVQDTTRRAVSAILKSNENVPLTVSKMAKMLTADAFKTMSKVELRQNVQNVVDRMVRHEQVEVVKGTKSTGRPVNMYRLAPAKTRPVAEVVAETATV
jgi:response regulator of citrate/malate metabolism